MRPNFNTNMKTHCRRYHRSYQGGPICTSECGFSVRVEVDNRSDGCRKAWKEKRAGHAAGWNGGWYVLILNMSNRRKFGAGPILAPTTQKGGWNGTKNSRIRRLVSRMWPFAIQKNMELLILRLVFEWFEGTWFWNWFLGWLFRFKRNIQYWRRYWLADRQFMRPLNLWLLMNDRGILLTAVLKELWMIQECSNPQRYKSLKDGYQT